MPLTLCHDTPMISLHFSVSLDLSTLLISTCHCVGMRLIMRKCLRLCLVEKLNDSESVPQISCHPLQPMVFNLLVGPLSPTLWRHTSDGHALSVHG